MPGTANIAWYQKYQPYVQRAVLNGLVDNTTQTISFTNAPKSGNFLVLIVNAGSIIDTPAGWVNVAVETNNEDTKVFTKTSNGTETNIAVTCGGSSFEACIAVYEFSKYSAFDQKSLDFIVGGVNTATFDPTPTTTTANELVMSIIEFGYGPGQSPLPMYPYTSGFIEDVYVVGQDNAGANFKSMSIAIREVTATGAYSTRARWQVATPVASTSNLIIVTFK